MEKKTEKQLREQFTFDQYGRYAIIRDIVNANRKAGQKFKILDVGGRGNFLKLFLSTDEVFFMDPFLDSSDDNFIKGDGCEMTFENNCFDWVVSADVFEHIDIKKREKFLDENIRVAKIGVVLAAPFNSIQINKAEINVNECYKIFSGTDYKWLKEHIDNELPEEKNTEEYIRKLGYDFQKISNNNLFLWELSIILILNAGVQNVGDVSADIKRFNYFYNTNVFPYDFSEPSYRKIYFIKKEKYLKNLYVSNMPISHDLLLDVIGNVTRLSSKFSAITKMMAENKSKEIDFILSSKFWKLRNIYISLFSIPKIMLEKISRFRCVLKRAVDDIQRNKKSEGVVREIYNYSKKQNRCYLSNFGKKISIVMLSFNRLRDMKRAVNALYRYCSVPFEFIILDNGSDSEVKDYLKYLEKRKENLRVIFEKKNLGCAGGRKKAFSLAKGDYVISLDSDIVIAPFCLENLVEIMEKNKNIAGACCKVVFPDKKIQFNGGKYEVNRQSIEFKPMDGGKVYYDVTTLNQVECDWILGGATIWRKNIIDIYNFDDKMQGSHEDAEYSFMLRKKGYMVLNCPKAIAIHNHMIFNDKIRRDKKYFSGRYNNEKIRFAVKHFYKKHGLIISDSDVISKFGLIGRNEAEIIEFFMKPLISVIIPCYNYGKYIREAVESVLNQTFKNFEIIIINDGSTDENTLKVLNEIKKEHPDVKIIHQKNGHLSNARNNGIKASQGEFFLPLDADDTIESTMLEKCYYEMVNDPKLGMVYTYIKAFGDVDDFYWRNPEYNFYDLLFQNHPSVCSLIRKSAWEEIGGYDECMKDGYEDWEFWINLGEKGWFGKVIKEFLFNYRKHGKSMITDAESKHEVIVRYIRNKHKKLYTHESLGQIKRAWKKE